MKTLYETYIETDDCKTGFAEFKAAAETDGLPEKYTACIKGFNPDDKDNYFWKYIANCDIYVITN